MKSDSTETGAIRLAENEPKARRHAMYKAISTCQNAEDVRLFMRDLCTPQELDTMAERFLIARLLAKGDMSYRAISAVTGASTTTVGRVARFLQQEANEGYKNVLRKIEECENAGNQAQ